MPGFTAFALAIQLLPRRRAGGGSRNRWGAEKHRNVSSSSLLQKYTAQMATWKHRVTQTLVPGTGKEAGLPTAFALADFPVPNKRWRYWLFTCSHVVWPRLFYPEALCHITHGNKSWRFPPLQTLAEIAFWNFPMQRWICWPDRKLRRVLTSQKNFPSMKQS